MKIKVLHVVLSMETGGLENGIVNLVNNSDQEEFCVDVLCLRARGDLADRITNPNSQIIFNENSNHTVLSAVKDIYSACKEGGYHIIHSHGFATMLACYITSKFTHSTILINGEHGTLYTQSAKQRILQKFLFKRMKLNLSVSENLKRDVIELFNLDFDNFKPIINGVDSNKFNKDDTLRDKLRQELKLQDNDILIGSVGRLVKGKNYKSLIKAFSLISNSNNKLHLILAGDGPEMESLYRQVIELQLQDRVHLLGRRGDIPRVMNAMDIFVLPSFKEGLSNTLLEAMSCGTPVVACHVGGNSEIVIPNVTGHLYESDNVKELSEILTSLTENKEQLALLAQQARKHIVENHSLVAMVRNYESTYIDLLTINNIKKYPNKHLS